MADPRNHLSRVWRCVRQPVRDPQDTGPTSCEPYGADRYPDRLGPTKEFAAEGYIFVCQEVLHTFERGHRVMVQVQSSLFPLFDRNPQSWMPSILQAEASDFVKATHRVWRSAAHPSALEVGVLPAAAPVVQPVADEAD